MSPSLTARAHSTAGIEYELSADRALGVKGHDWFGHAALTHQFASASKALRASQQMAKDTAEFDKLDDEQKAAQQAQFAAQMQNSLYNLMAIDIESTVASAVAKCCADTSVSKDVRRERAKGLLKLGKIFRGVLPPAAEAAPATAAAPAAAAPVS